MDHHHSHVSHASTGSPPSGATSPSGHTGHDTAAHSMFFVLSSEVTVWFENWTVNSVGGVVGVCIGLFFAATLYEGLKWFREYLLSKAICGVRQRIAMKSRIQNDVSSNGNVSNGNVSNGGIAMSTFNGNNDQVEASRPNSTFMRIPIIDHVMQTLMHMLQVFVSYLLMLAFMTYNVWIGLAVVLGAGFGYFVFASRVPKLPSVSRMSEHCH